MEILTALQQYLATSISANWDTPIQSLTWLYKGMSAIGLEVDALIVKMPDKNEYWHFNTKTLGLSPCDGMFVIKLEMGLLDKAYHTLQVEGYQIYYPLSASGDPDPINPERQVGLRLLLHFAVALYAKTGAEKQLVNAKRTFELTFEQVGSGRCVTDLEGWIQDVNEKFCEIIGYSLDETLKLRVKDLTYPEDWDSDWALKERLFAGEIPHFSIQKRYIKKDGSLTWVYTTVTMIRGTGDQPDYLIGIVQDINAQKTAELWLQHENEKLENQVMERTKQLVEANAIKDQTIQQLQALQDLLVRTATIDPLTSLYNRRYMLDQIAKEYSRCQRSHNTFSLILTDIDYFKTINDQRGHDCGDEVLQKVSTLLLAELRTMDVVCRWGGEEFLILLPDSSRQEALATGERIRQRVFDTPFSYDDANFHLTMTLGISTYVPGQSIKALVKAADHALYKGKAAGRNCVV